MKTSFQTHDLALPAWGPYTKLYSGISHIPQANDGARFDLSVFPGLYRRCVQVPNVRYESGFHVWRASPDLSCYTFRYELEWKDRVYVDVSFYELDENVRLIRAECHNTTENPTNLVLHYMASAHAPSAYGGRVRIDGADVHLPDGACMVAAKDYEDLHFAVPRPSDSLGWDGMRRAEEAVEGFTLGYGVGGGFGCAPSKDVFGRQLPDGRGDCVSYAFHTDRGFSRPCLLIRYQNRGKEAGIYTLSGGEQIVLPPGEDIQMAWTELRHPLPAGTVELAFTASGTGAAKLDCLILCEAFQREKVAITPRKGNGFPRMQTCKEEQFLTLKYPYIRECYGVVWNCDDFQIREIENDELDIFLRDTVHDHVSTTLRGNGKGHFANVFMRPIPLAPGEEKVLYGAVCCTSSEEETTSLCQRLQHLLCTQAPAEQWAKVSPAMEDEPSLPAGAAYAFGNRLMKSVLCTNVVYPVYTRGQYIRHNTPGRWWDSLYTWDSGFIGMGLAQFNARRGFDCLRAYLTEPGDDEAAFIHHGSLVPTQFYLFAELLNRTCSQELLQYCYPRLRQYYLFYSGQAGSSTTANLKSGLLRPWDYFYNSGGWDDYPPQAAVHAQHLEPVCTPVVTTSHAICSAKILSYAAQLLGETEDAARFLGDAERFADSLQMNSWDAESGYFGYVVHDEDGKPVEILRDRNGSNFNMGLGGISPLFAGVCTKEQEILFWDRMESGSRLWSGCGLSTVDQAAPYYRRDGYWNGAVWMPYQWLFFKCALDCGRPDMAFRIADTALGLWEKECELSYNCFEHFMIESRRGAGWHQFSGLSSPVVQWFASYYRPGTLTTGLWTFVREVSWTESADGVCARLDRTGKGPAAVLVALAPGRKRISCDCAFTARERHEGLWEIVLEAGTSDEVTLRLLPDPGIAPVLRERQDRGGL